MLRSSTTRRWRAACLGVSLAAVLNAGCGVFDPFNVPADIDEVDPDKYELEFHSCAMESEQATLDALGPPTFGDKRPPFIAVDFTIVNRDDKRRRFDLRATYTDANGVDYRMRGHTTNRRDPGDSTTETIRERVSPDAVPPFTCRTEVWDSIVDVAFPDD